MFNFFSKKKVTTEVPVDFSFVEDKPVEQVVVEPYIKIYPNTLSLEVVGEHSPEDLAATLVMFSNGEMSKQLAEALIKNGVSSEWIGKYKVAVKEIVEKEMTNSIKKIRENDTRPVISALEAFRST